MGKFKYRPALFVLAILFLAVLTIVIVRRKMNQEPYVVTGIGPVTVKNKIASGYKIIGKFKLFNPSPLPITDENANFIREKMPEWFAEHYPEEDTGTLFDDMSSEELVNKLKYAFTLLKWTGLPEVDVYLLKIRNGSKEINIYIGKGHFVDIPDSAIYYDIVYPFFDEEWHSNIKDPRPYRPGNLW